MKRKILTLALSLALCLALSITASAVKSDTDVSYPVTGGNIYFDKITGTVTGCDDYVTAANIPASIQGVTVKGIGAHAFSMPYGDLTSVTLPDTVTWIGDSAFYSAKFTGISLPSGLTRIGESAFSECNNLKSIRIPAGVSTVSGWAFYGCNDLKDVTLVNGISSLGDYAFSECDSLAQITIPDSVTNLGIGVFQNCDSLVDVKLSSGLSAIPIACFQSSERLASITIPEGVSVIEESAFWGCDSLSSISVPASVTSIESSGIYHTNRLATIYYGGTAAQWGDMDISDRDYLEELCAVAFDSYAKGVDATSGSVRGFSDVHPGDYYGDAVAWAKGKGITTGMSDTLFGASSTVTRGQAVTFLWRSNGCPEPNTKNNPFADVKSSDYYYKAVLWAVENSITNGTDATHFSPSNTCKYQDMLTFLWRSLGAPGFTGTGTYWYSEPMNWAYKSKMILTEDVSYSECPRADVVYFLWVALN
ncbi:MAG: leucine-rich repeat protein [Oscillospiraceae bacterium]|nr:leucine-rich repeat protein [Oscillospiraceae bacterium]